MVKIEYSYGGMKACFLDEHGDLFTVECDPDGVVVECLNGDAVSVCGCLDRPRVEALRDLLTRFLDTGTLRPEGEGAALGETQ